MTELQQNRPPIPVTIIAGFLGAGKTTLLNRILQDNHGMRVAVLVNDFGEINIDTQLLASDQPENMISLPNGCICCTLFTNVVTVIQKLLQLPLPPEYIILEASGVSSPDNVASILEVSTIQPYVILDSIITLVDAENAQKLARAVSFMENQIDSADILLVNKVDLVGEEDLQMLLDWIRSIAPAARILQTTYADVPLDLIMGMGRVSESGPASPLPPAAKPDHEHDHTQDHDQPYGTWTYTTDKPLARSAVLDLLAGLPASIYRAKGILYLADSPDQRHVLQVVGKRCKLDSQGEWAERPPETQLVFIGEPDALNPAELQANLNRCLLENS